MKKEMTYHWLPGEAIEFLKENVVYESRLKSDALGKLVQVDIPCRRRIGNYGTFHTQELHEYNLKDGSMAREFIQKQLDGSKSFHFFIGLYHKDKVLGWPEEAFESAK